MCGEFFGGKFEQSVTRLTSRLKRNLAEEDCGCSCIYEIFKGAKVHKIHVMLQNTYKKRNFYAYSEPSNIQRYNVYTYVKYNYNSKWNKSLFDS